jgi:hypothetical protein
MAFSYILAGVLYTHHSLEDASYDLAKYLYGSRSMHAEAAAKAQAWQDHFPGQIPTVYDGLLWTGSAFRAEVKRQQQAEIQAKRDKQAAARKRREDWQNASPMAVALREAGLA